ncbi:hypothetical protein STFE110948_01785 [Streptobacillus felis]|uniref:Uncharacterized protein n=3 Tax=Streptobacillus felis TaxID=1384509 RepID=A0A7Z0PGU0_9FUSO|nr:hypothetical protein [Streptobacillus felis]NYV28292.1 hypothetical protein [Streptobacillus felis]
MRELSKKEVKIKYSKNEFNKLQKLDNKTKIRKIESVDSLESAKKFFLERVRPETINKMENGAITGVGYNGETYTIRDYSKMGDQPVTIDINGNGFSNNKIKFIKK